MDIDSRDLDVSFSMHDILMNNSWIREKRKKKNFSRLLDFFLSKKKIAFKLIK